MQNDRLLVAMCALGLLAAGSANAQDQVSRFTARDGTQVTVTSGQPAADHYGPAPAFSALDANRDGFISRDEAAAYPPLLNDFDYITHHGDRVSKAQYQRWNQTQNR